MRSRGGIALTLALVVALAVVTTAVTRPRAAGAASLTQGALTMVSANKDRTDSAPTAGGTFGSEQAAISEDGQVVAFVSKTPAELLVNDPVQLAAGTVTDTNGVEDVFVWDARVPAPIGPVTTLVSWNASHTGTGGGEFVVDPISEHPIMAPGGLGIVFESRAKDLTAEPVVSDRNLYAWLPLISDVFPLFLVTINADGTSGANSLNSDPSIAVSLTPPLAKVVWTANADDLIPDPPNGYGGGDQVYVRDFVTQSTEMVSLNGAGDAGASGGASDPMISASGLKVVFRSGASDIQPGISGGLGNIWIRDLLTDTTTLVSENAAGDDGTSGNDNPVISADGTAVAWESNDLQLSPTPHNGNSHVFYRAGAAPVQMIDVAFGALSGCNLASDNPGISRTGTMVVFESVCSDIVPPGVGDDSGTDVFVWQAPGPVAQLVSINDTGTASGNGDSFLCPSSSPPFCGASSNAGVTMNADGSAVAFFSNSTDIAPPPVGPPPFNNGDVFIRYPFIGETVNATVTATGQHPDGGSRDPVFSADGGTVAFTSLAEDLVTPDTNDASDVFVSDLHNSIAIQPIEPVGEADGTVTVTLVRTGNNGTTDTVDFETVDGLVPEVPVPIEITDPAPANEPGDYTAKTGTVTFNPGETTKTVTIDINDDIDVETQFEVFRISLSDPGGAAKLALPGPLNQAYIAIVDDEVPPQDWSVAISQQPPASAEVGDTVTVEFTVTVDAGTDSLDLTELAAGAGTAGLDSISFDPLPPTLVPGSVTELTATARLVATPGTATSALEVSATGTLGSATTTKSATTNLITSTEAVTGALSAVDNGDGDAAGVTLADQITYTLALTNDSDTDAQLDGLPAGLVAPAGTTQASRTDGATTVAAGATSTWTLTVDVDDDQANGTVLTQPPTAVTYAMSDVALATRPAPITPPSVASTVRAPVIDVGPHTLTDVNGGALEETDTVDVSITVTNTGGDDVTAATLTDTLTNLASPTDLLVDGGNCGACSTTASSVTVPLGALAPSDSVVVTFSVTVPISPPSTTATSSATVAFSPATSGTSPTAPDETTATIAVEGAPVAVDDAYATDEDTPIDVLVADGVLSNDTDPENDTLGATIGSTTSAHGTVDLAADGSFTYAPDANFNGTATFTYVVDDGLHGGNTVTVTITVEPVNDAPITVDDNLAVTSDGGTVNFDVLSNDVDVDGDPLTVAIVVDPTHGDAACSTGGQCSYTPDAGFTGTDSMQYTVSDGVADAQSADAVRAAAISAPATVTFQVTAAQTTTTTTPGGTTSTTTGGGRSTGSGSGSGGTGGSLAETGEEVLPMGGLGLAALLLGATAVAAGPKLSGRGHRHRHRHERRRHRRPACKHARR